MVGRCPPVGERVRHATDSSTNASTSTYSYGAGGKITQVAIAVTPGARTISYVTDAAGQVMSRSVANSNGSAGPKEYTYWFDGLQVGEVGNNGTLNVDYSTAIARRATTPPANGFRNGTTATPYADLDTSFERVNGASVATTGSKYTVRDGDTLQSIAQQVWGDSSMWYLIAEANGLDGTEPLIGGSALAIPPKAMNIHNTSETFKVYDPNKALGDTSPVKDFQPKPTGKKGCGIVGQILIIAIAVAITAIIKVPVTGFITHMLAGSVLAAAAPVIGAMATGAIASAVSQGVGVATGMQDKFSWKGVAMSALSAGITQGVGGGELIQGVGKFANDMVRGALVNTATQGVAVATGLQDKFDWAGVAAAAVVSGVGGAVNRALAPAGLQKQYVPGAGRTPGISSLEAATISGVASSLAGAATRSIVTGTNFGDNILAVMPDVIGSTIGQAVASALTSSPSPRPKPATGPDKPETTLSDRLEEQGVPKEVQHRVWQADKDRLDRIMGGSNPTFDTPVPRAPTQTPSYFTWNDITSYLDFNGDGSLGLSDVSAAFYSAIGIDLSSGNGSGSSNDNPEDQTIVVTGIRAVDRFIGNFVSPPDHSSYAHSAIFPSQPRHRSGDWLGLRSYAMQPRVVEAYRSGPGLFAGVEARMAGADPMSVSIAEHQGIRNFEAFGLSTFVSDHLDMGWGQASRMANAPVNTVTGAAAAILHPITAATAAWDKITTPSRWFEDLRGSVNSGDAFGTGEWFGDLEFNLGMSAGTSKIFGLFGIGSAAEKLLPDIPTGLDELLGNPNSIYGRSAGEIASAFFEAGFDTNVRASGRGSRLSSIVEIAGHPEIAQIQVHPGGGMHGGSYVKISTSTVGTVKIVSPSYVPTPGEKAQLIWMGH